MNEQQPMVPLEQFREAMRIIWAFAKQNGGTFKVWTKTLQSMPAFATITQTVDDTGITFAAESQQPTAAANEPDHLPD